MAGIGNIFVAPHRRFIRLHTPNAAYQSPNEWLSRVRDIVWNLDKCIHTTRCVVPTAEHKKLFVRATRFNAVRALSVSIDMYMDMAIWDMGYGYGWPEWIQRSKRNRTRDANKWTEHKKVTQLRMKNDSYAPHSTEIPELYSKSTVTALLRLVGVATMLVEPEKICKMTIPKHTLFQVLWPKNADNWITPQNCANRYF